MTQADAAACVLERAGRPMHRREIATRSSGRAYLSRSGGSPGNMAEESVGTAITQETQREGALSRFEFEGGKGSVRFRLRGQLLREVAVTTPYSAWDTRSLRAGAMGIPSKAELRDRQNLQMTLSANVLRRARRQAEAQGIPVAVFIEELVEQEVRRLEIAKLERRWLVSYEEEPETDEERAELVAWQSILDPTLLWDEDCA